MVGALEVVIPCSSSVVWCCLKGVGDDSPDMFVRGVGQRERNIRYCERFAPLTGMGGVGSRYGAQREFVTAWRADAEGGMRHTLGENLRSALQSFHNRYQWCWRGY